MDISTIRNQAAQKEPDLKIVDSSASTPATSDVNEPDLAVNLVPQQVQADSSEKVSESVHEINNYVQAIQRNLQFSVDEDSGKTIVKVFDSQTDELVRQIPSEEVLAIAEYIKESGGDASGLILKVEV